MTTEGNLEAQNPQVGTAMADNEIDFDLFSQFGKAIVEAIDSLDSAQPILFIKALDTVRSTNSQEAVLRFLIGAISANKELAAGVLMSAIMPQNRECAQSK